MCVCVCVCAENEPFGARDPLLQQQDSRWRTPDISPGAHDVPRSRERNADIPSLRNALHEAQEAKLEALRVQQAAVESKTSLEFKLDKLIVVSQQDAENARREIQTSHDKLKHVSATHAKVVADERQRREQVERELLNTQRANDAFGDKYEDQQHKIAMLQHDLVQEQSARQELVTRLEGQQQDNKQHTETQGQLLENERKRREDLEAELLSLRGQAQQLAPLQQQIAEELRLKDRAVEDADTQNIEQEKYIQVLETRLQELGDGADSQAQLEELMTEKDRITAQHEHVSEQLHDAERLKATELDRMSAMIQIANNERDAAITRSRNLERDYGDEMSTMQQTLTATAEEVDGLKEKCSAAEASRKELQREVGDAARSFERLQHTCNEVQQERTMLRAELDQSKDNAALLESELTAFTSQSSESQQHAANLSDAYEDLQNRMHAQAKETDLLRTRCKALQQDMSESNRVLDDVNSRLQDAEDEADSQRSAAERLQAKLLLMHDSDSQKAAQLKEQLASHDKVLHDLQSKLVLAAEEKMRAVAEKDREASDLTELIGQFDVRIQQKDDLCAKQVDAALQQQINSEDQILTLEAQIKENGQVLQAKEHEIATLTGLVSEFNDRIKEKERMCEAEVARVRAESQVRADDAAVSDSHIDLNHAPYVLYGVKYIDLASLHSFQANAAAAHQKTKSDLVAQHHDELDQANADVMRLRSQCETLEGKLGSSEKLCSKKQQKVQFFAMPPHMDLSVL